MPNVGCRMSKLLTIQEAADVLGVNYFHVRSLVFEALEHPKKARWREGKHFTDLSPRTSKKRLIRIYQTALEPDD